MGTPPSALWNLQQDQPISQATPYALDDQDRAYIDSQALAAEYHLLNALLSGRNCSWFTLDAGSAAASSGDVVCSAGSVSLTVTRALAGPMALAGGALGIVIIPPGSTSQTVAPGSRVLVAMSGLVPQSITGLAAASGSAVVNTTTAKLASGTAGYAMGLIDSAGNALLSPGGSTAASSPKLFPYVDVANSVGGNASTLHASTAVTAGVSFLLMLASNIIIGMRFLWVAPGGGAVNVKCSLWTPTPTGGSPAATVTLTSLASGIAVAYFTTPYTVVNGDVGLRSIISTYAPGGGGGYYTQTSWVSSTSLAHANVPILGSPQYCYSDPAGGDHSLGNVFGLTATGGESEPGTEFGVSQYFAMEPIFQ